MFVTQASVDDSIQLGTNHRSCQEMIRKIFLKFGEDPRKSLSPVEAKEFALSCTMLHYLAVSETI